MELTVAGVGQLEEEPLQRKERLKALREKTGHKDKEDGEPKTKQLREEEEEDEDLKKRRVPQAKPVAVEEKVKEQPEAAKPEPVIEEVDLANLAPQKPDWDLKRDQARGFMKCQVQVGSGRYTNPDLHNPPQEVRRSGVDRGLLGAASAASVAEIPEPPPAADPAPPARPQTKPYPQLPAQPPDRSRGALRRESLGQRAKIRRCRSAAACLALESLSLSVTVVDNQREQKLN
ncbi:hypothetical protein P7K49_007603 [Saguinus oedipus]|uniref:Coiled-coil domain containing 12 n=1 Tax=Saguinus oedipus TaxID=9490 RepID=A0ABQ9VVJ8_SAGOE|nr:hypothetical protein P7K49_007603 [Saguinus oedipus]